MAKLSEQTISEMNRLATAVASLFPPDEETGKDYQFRVMAKVASVIEAAGASQFFDDKWAAKKINEELDAYPRIAYRRKFQSQIADIHSL